MSSKLTLVKSIIAGYPLLWLLAAMLHMADADVGGVEGLLSLNHLFSVSILAALLFTPCVIAVVYFSVRGTPAYWVVLLGAAMLIGGWLTFAGSTAIDFWGYVWSFCGITAICLSFMMPGTLPAVLYLRRGRQSHVR